MAQVGDIYLFKTNYAPNGRHYRVNEVVTVQDHGVKNYKFLCDFKKKSDALLFIAEMELLKILINKERKKNERKNRKRN